MREDDNLNRKESEIDLYLLFTVFCRGLKKFWWMVILFAAVGAGLMYVKDTLLFTPMYRSSASFTVMTETTAHSKGEKVTQSYQFYYDTASAGQLAKTFPYILNSSLLTDAIKKDLKINTLNGTLSAEAVENSNLVTVSVISTDPKAARAILESALSLYPEVAWFVIGNIRFNMIEVPTLPLTPYNAPDIGRDMASGAGLGIFISMVLVMLYALMRKTVQTSEELEKEQNLSCFGSIPLVRYRARSKKNIQNTQISIFNEETGVGFREGIHGIAMRVKRSFQENNGKVLVVTGTSENEGKSTIAVNLAWSLAARHKNVMLIDGDLRRQEDWKIAEIQESSGLGDLVLGKCSLNAALKKDQKHGIWFLGGRTPEKQIPLVLNHARLGKFIEAIKKHMDYIVIDTPPAGKFEDAQLFSEYADGILYVVRHDFMPKTEILNALGALDGCSAPVLGYVFNGAPEGGSYGYGKYGYGKYGYGKYGYGKYGYGKYGYSKYGYGGYGYGTYGDSKPADDKHAADQQQNRQNSETLSGN
ncbi:MAG: polysaccharide biosynthesis tyrosine autokinase [Catenibacillus sp.]